MTSQERKTASQQKTKTRVFEEREKSSPAALVRFFVALAAAAGLSITQRNPKALISGVEI